MDALQAVSEAFQLQVHVDRIEGHLHHHHVPNMQVTVVGADRSGIIAQVTNILFDVGFDILNLESDVAGTDEAPLYIMRIEGLTKNSLESVESALAELRNDGIDITVQPVETLVG